MTISRPKQTSPLFIDLKNDNRKEIYSHLPVKTLGLFAQTSYTAVEDIRKNARDILKKQLLHQAAFAEPVSPNQTDKSKLAAIQILRWYPELLFEEDYVKDLAGHTIYGSAYKIFLGAGDIWALKAVHEEVIPLIKDGEAIAQAQFKQQFPDGTNGSFYDDRNIAQIAEVTEDLKEIAAAISDDPCKHDIALKQRTIDAIHKLQIHLVPKEGEVIRSGMHSPPEILQIIHDVYDKYRNEWRPDQTSLYSCAVIGFAERMASVVDTQRYKMGLCSYDDEKSPPDRTIFCSFPKSPFVDAGELFFVNVFNGVVMNGSAYWRPDAGMENYTAQKSQALMNLYNDHLTPNRMLNKWDLSIHN